MTLLAALSAGAKTYLLCNLSIFLFSAFTERLGSYRDILSPCEILQCTDIPVILHAPSIRLKCYFIFPMCSCCGTSYLVSVRIKCPASINTLLLYCAAVCRQAVDANSSRAPGLISGLQGSVIANRGLLLLVPQ